MRKKFIQIVGKLEDDSTTEMERLLNMLNEKVESDKDACLELHDKIKKLLYDSHTLGKQFDELAFQGYKKCAEQMASADKLLSSMQNIDYQITFIPDVKIEEFLCSLETFGSFSVTPSGLDKLKIAELATTLIAPNHVYSVVNKRTCNVKTSEDIYSCNILGMCQLPGGQIAIVDRNNAKVKLLSKSAYCVLDELKLPRYPQDICHTTGTELAVTVCEKKDNEYIREEIHFINVGNAKLSHPRTVKLNHECRGIAYHNTHLYMGSDDDLYVYTLSGKKIKELYEEISWKYATMKRCSLNNDGSRIYITNFDKNLLHTFDSTGLQQSTFNDPDLQRPSGVCVAGSGSVFVCGQDSHTVLQVDREGKRKMATLATLHDGVYSPRSLFYDRKSHTLLVGQNNDNLLVLQLI